MSFILPILLSISPISELRGGIPAAIASGFHPVTAFLVCSIANALIILPIFFFLDYLHSIFLKINFYRNISEKILSRARKKAKKLEKDMNAYGYLALCIFTAIPLPMTGAYTATLIAWMLGLNKAKSFISIAFGVLIAGVLVTLASIGVMKVLAIS